MKKVIIIVGTVLISMLMISSATGLKITNTISNKKINMLEEDENLKYLTEADMLNLYTNLRENLVELTNNNDNIYNLLKEAIESSISPCDVEGYDYVLNLETLSSEMEVTKTQTNYEYSKSKQKDENDDQIQPLAKTLKITTKKQIGGIVAGAKVELWRVLPLGPAIPGLNNFYIPLWKMATGRTNLLGYCELTVRNVFFKIHAEKGNLKGNYPEYILSGTIVSIWDGDSKDITVYMKSSFDSTKSKNDLIMPIYRFQLLELLIKKFNIL